MENVSWIMDSIKTGAPALVGFLVKYLWDYYNSRKQLKQERIRKLEDLKSMLEESKNLFVMQNKLLRRLSNEVCERIKCDATYNTNGYENFLSQNYDNMTDVERDTHSVIRGTTTNSINIVNQELEKWIQADREFKINSVKELRTIDFGSEFAKQLNQLELHLNLWRDKYNVWMNNEKHCVVYLDDEVQHGVGFPKGIEDMVNKALSILSSKAKYSIK
jgi:hypothetical protein